MIFASTHKNKEALENYTELWDEVKDQIETINDDKPFEYKKDFRSVFQENNNYYPQVYLHEFLYEYEYEDDSYSMV